MIHSPARRARAVALMRLGHLLSLQRADEEQWALREVWRAVVLPLALRDRGEKQASFTHLGGRPPPFQTSRID